MQINQTTIDISTCQPKYVENLLKWFNMQGCKLVSIPIVVGRKLIKEDETSLHNPILYIFLIGILMYLITTRLDIMFVVGLVAKFMHQPHESH